MGKDGFEQFSDGVYVAIGKPWTPRGGLRPAADFVAFDEPGFAKMAIDLRALPEASGSRLETETRVFLTDAASRRRFAAYWLVVRPFSGLVRRSWLAAARRRAEARARARPRTRPIEPRRFETCPRDSPWDTSETASTVPGRCA